MFRHFRFQIVLAVIMAVTLLFSCVVPGTAYNTNEIQTDYAADIKAVSRIYHSGGSFGVRAPATWQALLNTYPNALVDSYAVPVPSMSWAAFIEPILEDDCTAHVFDASGQTISEESFPSSVVLAGQHLAVYADNEPAPVLLMNIVSAEAGISDIPVGPSAASGANQTISVDGPAASKYVTGSTISFRISCPGYSSASASLSADGLEFLRVELSAGASGDHRTVSLPSSSAVATYYYRVTANAGEPAALSLTNCRVTSNGAQRTVPDIRVGARAAVSYSCFVVTADRSSPFRLTTGATVLISVTASTNRFDSATATIKTTGLRFNRIEHSTDSMSDQNNLVLLPSNSVRPASVMYSYTITAQPGETLSLSVVDAVVSYNGYDMAVPDTVWSGIVVSPLPTPVPGQTPSASSSPSASPSTASPSPTASPSVSPSTSPSAAPSADAAMISPAAGSDLSVWDTSFGLVMTGLMVGKTDDFTSVGDVLSMINIPQGASVTVTDKDGQIRSRESPIATGNLITCVDASGRTETVNVVVRGDVIGTGLISLTQVVTIAKAFLGTRVLTGPYMLAADITRTGKISLTDIVQEAAIYVASRN